MSETAQDEDEIIKKILEESKTIAVVGASADEKDYSNRVVNYLKEVGYQIIPICDEEERFGEKCYPSVAEIPDDIKIDVVTIFLPSEEIPKIAEEAISRGVKYIWLQRGITHSQVTKMAKSLGTIVIQDRCMMTEHQRIF